MTIVITGGTGFLGTALAESLAADGHTVVALSRHAGGTYQGVRYASASVSGTEETARFDAATASLVASADAIVNLAGERIDAKRWTPARKAALRESRLRTTRAIVAALAQGPARPRTLISGSAVGYYGSDLTTIKDETSPAGDDFLATLCADWERAAQPAETVGARLIELRTGLVLARGGGLLARMVPPFKMFVGGPIGSGAQWMSWIHRTDWIRMVTWAIGHPDVAGPLNAVAPTPVTNRDFSTALGRALHRPALLPLPAPIVRLMFGELADGALLASQRAVPMRAQAAGFTFQFADLDAALRASI